MPCSPNKHLIASKRVNEKYLRGGTLFDLGFVLVDFSKLGDVWECLLTILEGPGTKLVVATGEQ